MNQQHEQTSEFISRIVAVQPRLRAYIRMMIFNPSDVSDVLQEVVTACWEHYEQYDNSRPFDAWLMGIARNRIYEYQRDQRKRAHPLSQEVLELIESEADDLDRSDSQIEDALESCLSKLSAEDHQMVRARYGRADSNREVSRLLGLSEPTVSRALNRIYARLLICIKQSQRGLEVLP